jgi:Flp pilus assembly protein TadG
MKAVLAMRRRNGAPGGARRGQSIVELALALPLLMLILLGTIDLGMMFHDYIQLRNASREGAGYGAHFPNDSTGIALRVTRHGVPAGTTVSSSCTSCTTSGGVPTGTGTVAVTAQSTFSPITLGFLQSWFGIGPIPLSSTATMRVLQ